MLERRTRILRQVAIQREILSAVERGVWRRPRLNAVKKPMVKRRDARLQRRKIQTYDLGLIMLAVKERPRRHTSWKIHRNITKQGRDIGNALVEAGRRAVVGRREQRKNITAYLPAFKNLHVHTDAAQEFLEPIPPNGILHKDSRRHSARL
ncbi:hypothetical protein D3C85_880210 [compost metagenome]